MSTSEYASHRGCSDSYVRRLRRRGLILDCPHGDIDVAATDRALSDNLNPVRGGNRNAAPDDAPPALDGPAASTDTAAPPDGASDPPPATISVNEAVRRERLARARLAELELGELSGQLIRRDVAARTTMTMMRNSINRFLLVSSKLRGTLAATSDPRKCQALIDDEVALICADLQKAAAQFASGDPIEAERAAA